MGICAELKSLEDMGFNSKEIAYLGDDVVMLAFAMRRSFD